MILFFSALLGSVLGSFANVVIIRWHEAAPISGRSKCPNCAKTIRPRHLVPILSWILLRGRCAECGKKIHVQYPLVEAAAAIFGVIAALRHDPLSDPRLFFFELLVTIGLLVPVVMDLRWKELPVEYLAGLGLFALFFHPTTIFSTVIAAAGVAAFFGIQFFLSRGRWIGEGDIWFGAMMGAVLGTPLLAALAVYLAYLLGGFTAFVLLVFHAVKRGSRVPFAPALAAGTLIALWHGERILSWIARGWF